jgi:ATP-dependent Lhr-like helicase
MGRILSTLLTSKIGAVGLQTDPYRIMIKLPGFQYRHVLETFRNIKPEEIEPILTLTLPNTELFTWRFIQVCQRLGIIARNADYGKAYIRKIISVYEKTPPYREALNEVFQDKLDVAKAKDVMEKIRSGRIRIHYQEGLSKLGEYGLSRKYEIVAPEKPEGHIFKAFKDRLLDTKIGLVCCNCGDIFSSYSIRNIPEKIICRKCEAKLIGYAPYNYVKEASKLVKNFQQGKAMDKEEKKHFDSMLDTATLIMSSGKKATLALAGRGVGPKAASRILSKNPSSEDELLNLILEEEKRFARTKRFWKG